MNSVYGDIIVGHLQHKDTRLQGNMYSVARVNYTFDYLEQGKRRLIVAGKYLPNDKIAFIDRKNSSLLITDTSDQSCHVIDLVNLLPDEYRLQRNPKKIPKPSDVNKGFELDQLLITFTGDEYSLAIACKLENGQTDLSAPLDVVKINKRTRSVIALDEYYVCADTEYEIIVKKKNDDNDEDVKSHPREKRDRGGLLMTDGQRNFYYGDGDTFVGCFWDGKSIHEKFRAKCGMKFPRGSAVSVKSGRIYICTDSSRSIFSISMQGENVNRELFDGTHQYGDIDFNSNGENFFTTFWNENEWPILYKIKS